MRKFDKRFELYLMSWEYAIPTRLRDAFRKRYKTLNNEQMYQAKRWIKTFRKYGAKT